MNLQPAKFSLDIIGDNTLEGFSNGESWNGWACPYFTLEQGHHLVEALNRAEAVMKSRAPGIDTLSGYYDVTHDAFVFHYQSQKHSTNPEEDWDTFQAIEIDGGKYYAIGAGCWIWEEVEVSSII